MLLNQPDDTGAAGGFSIRRSLVETRGSVVGRRDGLPHAPTDVRSRCLRGPSGAGKGRIAQRRCQADRFPAGPHGCPPPATRGTALEAVVACPPSMARQKRKHGGRRREDLSPRRTARNVRVSAEHERVRSLSLSSSASPLLCTLPSWQPGRSPESPCPSSPNTRPHEARLSTFGWNGRTPKVKRNAHGPKIGSKMLAPEKP